MTWNVAVKWIMLVSGLLTSTMIYAALAPRAAMLSTFGEALACMASATSAAQASPSASIS